MPSKKSILIENPQEKCRELAKLLIESWDALAAATREHHSILYNISPTLINRIEDALKPWASNKKM